MEFFDTYISDKAKQYVQEVLDSGYINDGEWVVRFEKELEKTFGYVFGVATNSCTSALHMALILSGVKQGDEIILPAQTFVATGLAVLYCGAKPIFADIGMDGNISVDSVSKRITKKTKAVIAVSWGGNPCDLIELDDLCSSYHLKLIQDNAQALGATYSRLPIATTGFGDFSCFSFQAIKHLTTGDGGFLVCKSYDDYKRARKLRWFGIDKENDKPDGTGERVYDLMGVGYKYNMNNIQAALGLGNLELTSIRQHTRDIIALHYDLGLSDDIKVTRKDGSSNWLYNLLVDKRDEFMEMMASKGIPASVVHVGIDRNNIFSHNFLLPVQRYWDEHHVCIPCHPDLTTEDTHKIIEAIQGGW